MNRGFATIAAAVIGLSFAVTASYWLADAAWVPEPVPVQRLVTPAPPAPAAGQASPRISALSTSTAGATTAGLQNWLQSCAIAPDLAAAGCTDHACAVLVPDDHQTLDKYWRRPGMMAEDLAVLIGAPDTTNPCNRGVDVANGMFFGVRDHDAGLAGCALPVVADGLGRAEAKQLCAALASSLGKSVAFYEMHPNPELEEAHPDLAP